MKSFRLPQRRAGGTVAMFLLALAWPATSIVLTEAAPAATLEASALWLAPAASPSAGKSPLADAVDDLADGKAAKALPALERMAREQVLGGYSVLYLGRAQLALNKLSDARLTADRLLEMRPVGFLGDAALLLAADIAETTGEWPAAVTPLRRLVAAGPLEPERVNLRLGRVALKAGDSALAASAFERVFYEFAATPEASEAATDLNRLTSFASADSSRRLYRAEALYTSKKYSEAKAAFTVIRGTAGVDPSLIDVRVAACDYFLKRYAAARDELLPLAAAAVPQQIDAEFFYFSTLRELGRHDEYVTRARAFIDAHPTHPLAEEALNSLATHYVLANDDAQAADVLTELYARFPAGPHASRAAWRAGWWRYRTAAFGEAIRFFESAAVTFPHDDYRPSWLYWAARAHQRLGDPQGALAGFRKVVADYRHSYYGRQAVRAMAPMSAGEGQASALRPIVPVVSPGPMPANAAIIRELLSAGLYDTAILELRKAEMENGRTPLLEATIAYALNRKGDLRDAISKMRRAYPQFMADGGETFPLDLRRVIFPVAFTSVIARGAEARNLDPYLMTALVAQESTFKADAKSSAGARGLMQIEPGTGRLYATRLQIRPYSTNFLTQPEVNVRIGMATFADLTAKFGSVAVALAAYNAGDGRAARWLADRRQLDQDEFIDDIPYPETQNYVKRVLGTAEDYRALYPDLASVLAVVPVAKPAVKPIVKPVVKKTTRRARTDLP